MERADVQLGSADLTTFTSSLRLSIATAEKRKKPCSRPRALRGPRFRASLPSKVTVVSPLVRRSPAARPAPATRFIRLAHQRHAGLARLQHRRGDRHAVAVHAVYAAAARPRLPRRNSTCPLERVEFHPAPRLFSSESTGIAPLSGAALPRRCAPCYDSTRFFILHMHPPYSMFFATKHIVTTAYIATFAARHAAS